MLGTRFVLSEEANAALAYKQRLMESRETVLTHLFGMGWPAPHRVIWNEAAERWLDRDGREPRWLSAIQRVSGPVIARLPMGASVRPPVRRRRRARSSARSPPQPTGRATCSTQARSMPASPLPASTTSVPPPSSCGSWPRHVKRPPPCAGAAAALALVAATLVVALLRDDGPPAAPEPPPARTEAGRPAVRRGGVPAVRLRGPGRARLPRTWEPRDGALVYALSPGGVEASVARTTRWRARSSARSPARRRRRRPRGDAVPRERGPSDGDGGRDADSATGLMQIIPSTAMALLGMRVDLARSLEINRELRAQHRRAESRARRRSGVPRGSGCAAAARAQGRGRALRPAEVDRRRRALPAGSRAGASAARTSRSPRTTWESGT